MIKKIKILFLLITASSLLINCGGGKEKVASSKNRKVITILHYGGMANIQKMKAVKRRYEKTHPGVELQVVHAIGEPVVKRYLLMASSGNAPDVATITVNDIGNFISKGSARVMDDYINGHEPFVKNIKPQLNPGSALEYLKFNDQYYGLPIMYNPSVMYVNKDLFQKNDIPLPNRAFTREELELLIQKIKVDPTKPGNNYSFNYEFQLRDSFLYAKGKTLLDKNGKVQFLSPEHLATYSWLKKHYVSKQLPSYGSEAEQGITFFLTGKLLSYLGLHSDKPVAMNSTLNWDLLPPPRFSEDGKSRVLIGSIVVKQDLKYPKEVFELLDEMLAGEYQKGVLQFFNEVPLLSKYQKSERFLNATPQISNPQNLMAPLDNPFYGEKYLTSEITAPYGNAFETAMNDGTKAEKIEEPFKIAAQEIEKILAERKANGEFSFDNY